MLRIYRAGELSPQQRTALLLRASAEDRAAPELVREIVDRVEREGAAAVIEYTRKFDGVDLGPHGLLVQPAEFDAAEARLDDALKAAFRKAAENITAYHRMQREALVDRESEIDGARLGFRYVPVDGAGVYVPGGKAAYPSSVLMGLIPAHIAGVPHTLVITPPDKSGSVDPAVLYCARLSGCERVLKAGGAQGIAAAAFGLGGQRVQVIAGPGNRYVMAAKSILTARGLIRMDMPAGPSEVVVIADETANAQYVAADLLSQAEHGEDSPAVLLTDSYEFARAVDRAVIAGIAARPERSAMKSTSIREHSFAIVYENLEEAFAFANDYGAEHLELCTADPVADLRKITSAGSVFLGHFAPVALGDYYSGTNHVLPTGGAARAYSGLGVEIFLKRISYQYPTRDSLRNALEPILLMSKHEGLDQEHGHSVTVRFSAPDTD
jgi:histidinol dehydrogenase